MKNTLMTLFLTLAVVLLMPGCGQNKKDATGKSFDKKKEIEYLRVEEEPAIYERKAHTLNDLTELSAVERAKISTATATQRVNNNNINNPLSTIVFNT